MFCGDWAGTIVDRWLPFGSSETVRSPSRNGETKRESGTAGSADEDCTACLDCAAELVCVVEPVCAAEPDEAAERGDAAESGETVSLDETVVPAGEAASAGPGIAEVPRDVLLWGAGA